jgi:hypothetical protein
MIGLHNATRPQRRQLLAAPFSQHPVATARRVKWAARLYAAISRGDIATNNELVHPQAGIRLLSWHRWFPAVHPGTAAIAPDCAHRHRRHHA